MTPIGKTNTDAFLIVPVITRYHNISENSNINEDLEYIEGQGGGSMLKIDQSHSEKNARTILFRS